MTQYIINHAILSPNFMPEIANPLLYLALEAFKYTTGQSSIVVGADGSILTNFDLGKLVFGNFRQRSSREEIGRGRTKPWTLRVIPIRVLEPRSWSPFSIELKDVSDSIVKLVMPPY